MAASFDSFNSFRVEAHSKFIPYTGPPAPKSHSERRAPKAAASIVGGRHALDHSPTVELRLGPNPENEGRFVSASSDPPLNLSDGRGVCDFRTDNRIGDDGNGFGFGLHLQDEARGTGWILSQPPNTMQHRSADQGPIQVTSAGNSIHNEQKNSEIDGNKGSSGHERAYDIGCDVTRSCQNERKAVGSMQSRLVEKPCEGGTGELSTQPVTTGGGSCEDAIVVADNDHVEYDVDINDGNEYLLQQSDQGVQTNRQVQHAGTLVEGSLDKGYILMSIKDITDSSPAKKAKVIADLTEAEFDTTFGSDSLLSASEGDTWFDPLTDQSTHMIGRCTVPRAMTGSAKVPVARKANTQGKLSTSEATGNGDDSDEHSGTDDNNNNGTRPARSASVTRKRKRYPLAKRNSRMSNKASEHHSKYSAHSARQQKPPLPGGTLFSKHPSRLHSLPALQECSYDNKMYCNDDSSDDRSEGSDLESNILPKSTAQKQVEA